MARIDIKFAWRVAPGYVIVDSSSPLWQLPTRGLVLFSVADDQIVPRRGRAETKEPILLRPTLFLDFAALDGSAESCLAFAKLWGLLGLGAEGSELRQGEFISDWQRCIKDMRAAVAAWREGRLSRRTDLPAADLKARLREAPGGGYMLELAPPSLWSALRLQFSQTAASDKTIRACDHCGTWFEAGQGTTRRADARFCSDICRTRYHNALKSKGAKT